MNSSREINNSWEFQLPRDMRFGWYKHQNSLVEFYEHDCMEYETFDFYFRTALCNDISDPELAWVIGTELASLFNGASKIQSSDPRLLTILNLYGDNRKLGCFQLRPKHLNTKDEMDLADLFGDASGAEVVEEVESALSFDPARIRQELRSLAESNVDLKNQTGLQWQTHLVKDCVSDDTTYDVLKYFDSEYSWGSLYKIYETLEREYKANAKEKGLLLKVFETGCTLKERFKFSANKYQVSGVEGRHARNRHALFSKEPLSFADSVELWRETAKAYFEWRIGVQMQTV